jgi:hypothetical protein
MLLLEIPIFIGAFQIAAQLAFYAISTMATTALAARANRKGLKDVSFPQIDPDRPVAYIAGTVKHDAPQVLWYGDFKRSKVTMPGGGWIAVATGVAAGFLGAGAILGAVVGYIMSILPLGYRYYLGIGYGLCHGDVDAVEAVYINDKSLWTGTATGGQTLLVSKPGVFGLEGGVHANLTFYSGDFTQESDPYLKAQQTAGHYPAHRGYSYVVWRGPSSGDDGHSAPGQDILYGGYIGRSTSIKPIAFKLRRQPNPLGASADAYKAVNTAEANPALVIADLLTNEAVGMGLPVSMIDTASFIAAAQTLQTEGLGTSFIWSGAQSIEKVIQEQIDLIDCVVYSSVETGQITIDLIRDDYVVAALPTVTVENASDVVSFRTRTPEDAPNEVKVSFTNISNNFKQDSALFQSLATRRIQGERTPTEVSYPVGSMATAMKLATRDGLSSVLPLHEVTLKANRETWSFRPGSVFKFVWADYDITQMLLRVVKVNLGSLDDPEITLDCVEDRFSIGASAYGVTEQTSWEDTIPSGASGPPTDTVRSASVTSPPASPADGDAYIIPAGATGAWAGRTNEIAFWDGDSWVYYETAELSGVTVYNLDDEVFLTYDATNDEWVPIIVGDTSAGGGTNPLNPAPAVATVLAGRGTSALLQENEFNLLTEDGGSLTGEGDDFSTHTSTGTWEDIGGMAVTVLPQAASSLVCQLTADFAAALASACRLRFILDPGTADERASEYYKRKDSTHIHTVFEGVEAGPHEIRAQWHDDDSGLDCTFEQRRLTVEVGQAAASGNILTEDSITLTTEAGEELALE